LPDKYNTDTIDIDITIKVIVIPLYNVLKFVSNRNIQTKLIKCFNHLIDVRGAIIQKNLSFPYT
jgi:hypothetical protein